MTRAIERAASTERAAGAVESEGAQARRARLVEFGLRALIVALLAMVALQVVAIWIPNMQNGEAPPGMDYGFYVERTQSWLDGDGFYRDRQLHGPYDIENGDALYPPPIVLLMLPWVLGAPAALWWAIPIALAMLALRKLRPPLWAWAVLAAVLVYKRTLIAIVLGNPAIWAFAGILAGAAWGAPGVLALVKPILAPFALTGWRHRSFWIALAVVGSVSLLFLPMWPTYLQVLRDAHNTRDVWYVIGEVPTGIALAVVAVASRGRLVAAGAEPDAFA
jgi:hypothetical protein